MQQIVDWLEKLGMSEYAQRFAENDIDIEVLGELTDTDFDRLGVSIGHRRKLLKALAAGVPEGKAAHPSSVVAVRLPLVPSQTAEAPLSTGAAGGERRHVTVMFCDLVGSTDGLGLAELVKKKRVKPAELVEAAIERIERHNPQLNAVVFKAYDDARARATTVPAKLLDCVPGACSHAAAFDRLHPGCEGNGYAPAPALPRSRQHRLAVAADALNDAQRPLAQTRKHRRDHPRRYRQRQQS